MQNSDEQGKQLALDLLRSNHPDVVEVTFESSDQNYYGFWFLSATGADGAEVELTDTEIDEINDHVHDVAWDGVMGEDRHGYATIKLED